MNTELKDSAYQHIFDDFAEIERKLAVEKEKNKQLRKKLRRLTELEKKQKADPTIGEPYDG